MCPTQSEDKPILVGNPARRAGPTIRGYAYQIWRGVEAWLEISENELLYIEGAEDIDRVSEQDATAIQIKDTAGSGSLTLNSKDALEAINNCWRVIDENRDRVVKYQFVTTAKAGVEKEKVGTEGGIRLWQFCSRLRTSECNDEINELKSHLLKSEIIDPEIKEFLQSNSNEDIHSDFISQLEWLFDEPDLTEIKESIVEHLLVRRPYLALPVTEAKRLADQLYQDILVAAIKPILEPLTILDLHTRIDEYNQVQVPRTGFLAATDIPQTLLSALLDQAQGAITLTLTPAAAEDYQPPPLLPNSWPRPNLLSSIRKASPHIAINIVGSTGMGKTTAVLQHISEYTNLLWVSCRDLDLPALNIALHNIREVLAATPDPQNIILDDFNHSDDFQALEVNLARLMDTVRNTNSRIILTTYANIGFRLARILSITPDARVSINHFTEDEIESFLKNHGCPPTYVSSLAKIVLLQTSGHPTLVAARTASLHSINFPLPLPEQLIEKPRDILDIQQECSATIASTLDEPTRQFLYTLTIMTGVAKRTTLQRIADLVTEGSLSGEFINAVYPTWLEEPHSGLFCVSPIIKGLGTDIFSPDELKERHKLIAESIFKGKRITPQEFGQTIFHAFYGGADSAAIHAIMAFIHAPKELQKILADYVFWLVAIREDAALPFSTKFTSQFFRILQWEVTQLKKPKGLASLSLIIDQEIPADIVGDPGAILMRFLWVSKKLMYSEFHGSVRDTVNDFLEFRDLASQLSHIHREIEPFSQIPIEINDGHGLSIKGFLTAALIPKIKSCANLKELLEVINDLDESRRKFFLEAFGEEGFELRVLFLGPWNGIFNESDEFSYRDYAEILKEAVSAGSRWQHSGILAMAARTYSALADEVLGDRESAESVINEAIAQIGETPNLSEQIAGISYHHGEYEAALRVWRDVLPKWPPDPTGFDTQPADAMRLAGIAAANIENWEEASDWFSQARNNGGSHGKIWRLGMIVDHGYALWKAENRFQSLQLFEQGLAELDMFDEENRESQEFGVIKMIGGCLSNLVNPSKESAAGPGMCSDVTNYERAKELPPTRKEYIWFLLYELSAESENYELATKCLDKCRHVKNSIIRVNIVRAEIRDSLSDIRLDEIALKALEFGECMVRAKARMEVPAHELDPEDLKFIPPGPEFLDLYAPIFHGAIIVSIASGRTAADLIQAWKSSVADKSEILTDYLTKIEDLCFRDDNELVGILRDGTEEHDRKRWAAVLLLERDVSPDDAVHAQLEILAVAWQNRHFWSRIGSSFDKIVRRTWQQFLEKRFLLRSPGVSSPLIEAACKNPLFSWSSATDVVFTALGATNLRISDSFMTAAGSAREADSS